MHFDPTTFELPAQLQRRVGDSSEGTAEMPRRTFLKVATASGFALGAFPIAASAQATAPAAGLKPFEQPSAFVRIRRTASSPSPSTAWISARACRPGCR